MKPQLEPGFFQEKACITEWKRPTVIPLLPWWSRQVIKAASDPAIRDRLTMI
jgi:hypothetical protein